MLSAKERIRFNALRNREHLGPALSDDESLELAAFVQRIEDAESATLAASNLRRRQESLDTEERIAALNALIEREEQFAARLRDTLDNLHEERDSLKAERQRLVAASQAARSL